MTSHSEVETLDLTTTRTSVTGRSCFNRGTIQGPLQVKGSGKRGYMRARCKRYDCAFCGPSKLRQARKRIAAVATERKLTRFVTLTLDSNKLQGQPSIPYLSNTWAKMRVSLARKFGRSLEYVGVVQLQKSGVAHLHLLVGCYIQKAWLSEAWSSLGGGEIVDIRLVDVHRVSAYLSRYLARVEQLPAGTRRFRNSKGICLSEEKKASSGWTWSPCAIERLYANRELLGERVSDERFEAGDEGTSILVFFVAE